MKKRGTVVGMCGGIFVVGIIAGIGIAVIVISFLASFRDEIKKKLIEGGKRDKKRRG